MAEGGGQQADSDAVLLDFLSSLLDYTPTIPDELAEHYLSRSGFQCPDIRVTRLVSVAAQKFISEIASDALQFCKIRQANVKAGDKSRGHQGKDKRLILTTEDLSAALKEYGVNVKKQEYFADSPAAGTVTVAVKEKQPEE
ncbi:transcription initiation factor TFIID subunit 10 [Marchantia polymorpha subsp. ruderalis]|uniref:Transcription initiation factor TFIID subunit 10 n=2 Tax=Marchantia polymorpha TaxID=3197 RepID=A0A176VNR1_MARPO|nr:hypothetical protein AXG93_3506s1300 [Marchantia polymorpha subsp. ruderalis]PTQ46427.1 hypothetical protein MARPO_0011s0105 [Marchantia polymorpha]BBN08390.1 hypothetical protein Mp_4g11200 [Marchantia polymorpha subsp. ruderalis]|eukprot:PTQ46427.1 hypothetical protein MARPO_0011s0105 [Marchantia polymorpha]